MIDSEAVSFIWVCIVQALFVLFAAGTVVGLMLREARGGYEPRHRADRFALSTWQSHGRVFRGHLTMLDPDDLDSARAAVEATAVAIEERVELWNRELLTGPLFQYDPAPDRYEPSAGDPAYLELGDASLARAAQRPARPHPARVDTSELPLVEVDAMAGVP